MSKKYSSVIRFNFSLNIKGAVAPFLLLAGWKWLLKAKKPRKFSLSNSPLKNPPPYFHGSLFQQTFSHLLGERRVPFKQKSDNTGIARQWI
jgi:hypothetical protein